MALIPGSYARAAGLQSEINKVTITRVAGGEVQFRRTIDSYQRDLRYHVNQIGREQKQLKRSMRKYCKRLHDSKKERKKREAKEKEDIDRQKHNAESFRQAEEAVKRAPLIVTNTAGEAFSEDVSKQDQDGTASNQSSNDAIFSEKLVVVHPGTPDSSKDRDSDEKSNVSPKSLSPKHGSVVMETEAEIQQHRRAFITKSKVPYFRAKRGRTDNSIIDDEQSGTEQVSCTVDQSSDSALTGDNDFLPVINEEAEDTDSRKLLQATEDTSTDPLRVNKLSQPESITPRHISLNMSSLDTKVASEIHRNCLDGTTADSGSQGHSDVNLPFLSTSVQMTRRRSERNTGVSFGDLIKLQHTHTSNTKKLFKMVDRLASKHGIVDLPPVSTNSLDPRSNDKIKMRGDGPESQMSDGMVKQAAVLYSMKYGYQISDDALSDSGIPSLLFSDDVSDDLTARGDIVSPFDPSCRDHADSRLTEASRKLSLISVKDELAGMTSPYYVTSDVMSSIFDENHSVSMYSSLRRDSLDASSSVRSRNRQALSMSELSVHASRIRERTLVAADAYNGVAGRSISSPPPADDLRATGRTEFRSERRSSPLPRHSRSLSRPRRASVTNELQKRLIPTGQSDAGNMAWQSAFGRLKVLHTLHDLSQHFTNDTL